VGLITEVSIDDIEKLNEDQLTKLLHKLLYAEMWRYGFSGRNVDTCMRLKIADGGKDAHIDWPGEKTETEFVKTNSLFQVKAAEMGPTKCYEEMLGPAEKETGNRELKPAIKRVVESNGAYVLFCNKDGIKDERIAKMREALVKAGKLQEFANAFDLTTYDTTKISEWVNRYPAIVCTVKEFVGSRSPLGMQTLDKWKAYKSYCNEFVSHTDAERDIERIVSRCSKPGGIVRIVGLSGLGKSRLCLQALDSDETRSQVAYLDAGKMHHYEILPWIMSARERDCGIIVVDNCKPELHALLVPEIEHPDNKGLSLITCYFLSEEEGRRDQEFIRVGHSPGNVVEQILSQGHQGRTANEIARLTEYCGGFPQMAVLFAQQDLSSIRDITLCADEELTNRLLWGDARPDPVELNIIEVCALFDTIGYDNKQRTEREFLALKLCGGITGDKFYSVARKFTKMGILEQFSDYVRMRPKPIAWRLANRFWDNLPSSFAETLCLEEWPPRLIDSLCNQMKYINDTPAARAVAETLCSDNFPFVSAEGLNTEKGSRLFSALCDVDPEISMKWLKEKLSRFDQKKLLEYGPGRRNLIFALEKLCLFHQTFDDGASLLGRFAAAENEKIGNNATGQFTDLFQVYLPGTEVNLERRLNLLDEFLTSSNDSEVLIGVKACEKGLEYAHFTRMNEVPRYGKFQNVRDYQPDEKERDWYWGEIVKRLVPFAKDHGESGKTARAALERFSRVFVRENFADALDASVREIAPALGGTWPAMSTALSTILREPRYRLSDTIKSILISLLHDLEPKAPDAKFEVIVRRPSFHDLGTNARNVIVDYSARNALKFGLEVGRSWAETQLSTKSLLIGEQRQGHSFGRGFARALGASGRKKFINDCFQILEKVPQSEVNLTIFGSVLRYVCSIEHDHGLGTLERLSLMPSTVATVPWLLTRIGVSEPGIQLCNDLLASAAIDSEQYYVFGYGKVLDQIPVAIVSSMVDSLVEKGIKGIVAAFFIIYMYSFQHDEKFAAVTPIFRQLLMTEGLLADPALLSTRYVHEWFDVTEKLLKLQDVVLAAHIADEILRVCELEGREIYTIDRPVEKILNQLLGEYRSVTWPKFSPLLLEDRSKRHWNLKTLLCNRMGLGNRPGPLFSIPVDVLFRWCEEHPERAPSVIARNMPAISRADDGKERLSDIALQLLDRYGNDERVLLNVSANLGTWVGWGNASEIIDKQSIILAPLLNHKNRKVREWSKNQIESANIQGDWFRKRDEEFRHGINGDWDDDWTM